jgi:hypothetical protein
MNEYYEITCNDESLGVTIPYDNLVIKSVDKGGVAANQGVRAGDVVCQVDNNPVGNLETLKMLLGALERPFQVTLSRGSSAADKEIERGSDSGKLIPDMGILKAMGVKSSEGSGSSSISNNNSNSSRALSAAQAQERREAMMRAAQQREGAWDKRVKSGSARRVADGSSSSSGGGGAEKPVYDHSEAARRGDGNAETQRMVAAARRAEAQTAQAMGYSPFVPHSSTGFTSTVGVGSRVGAAAKGEGGTSSSSSDSGGLRSTSTNTVFERVSESSARSSGSPMRALESVGRSEEEQQPPQVRRRSKTDQDLAHIPTEQQHAAAAAADLISFEDDRYDALGNENLQAVDAAFEQFFANSSEAGEERVLLAIATVTRMLDNLVRILFHVLPFFLFMMVSLSLLSIYCCLLAFSDMI